MAISEITGQNLFLGDLKITTNRGPKDKYDGPVVLVRSGFLIPAGTPLETLTVAETSRSGVLMSDTLQLVVISRKKSITETGDKLKCVGHQDRTPKNRHCAFHTHFATMSSLIFNYLVSDCAL